MGEVRRGCFICRTEPEECSGCQIERLTAEREKLKTTIKRYHQAFLDLTGCPYCEGIGALCAEHTPQEKEEDEDENDTWCECCDDCGMSGSEPGHCAHCC